MPCPFSPIFFSRFFPDAARQVASDTQRISNTVIVGHAPGKINRREAAVSWLAARLEKGENTKNDPGKTCNNNDGLHVVADALGKTATVRVSRKVFLNKYLIPLVLYYVLLIQNITSETTLNVNIGYV